MICSCSNSCLDKSRYCNRLIAQTYAHYILMSIYVLSDNSLLGPGDENIMLLNTVFIHTAFIHTAFT